jgi:GTP cyclohydrolase I
MQNTLRKFKRISDIESSTVTSEFGGKFKDPQARREFLDYIKLETKF